MPLAGTCLSSTHAQFGRSDLVPGLMFIDLIAYGCGMATGHLTFIPTGGLRALGRMFDVDTANGRELI
jgi:hypothetical protein